MRTHPIPSLVLAALTASLLAPSALAAARAAAVDVPPLRSRYTPEELAAGCAKAEQDADAKLAALVAVPDAKRTFKDSFEALDAILGDYGETVARLSFLKDVHPQAPVRDAGAACEERAGKWSVAVSARKDLYLAMKGFLDNAGKTAKLDAEQARLVEITMRDFKRNGLELSDADRAKLVELRSRLTELQTRFSKNLNEDATKVAYTKAELAGLPDDFIAAHEDKAKKGTYVLSTKYPDYYPVMENASKEATRKKMETAFMNRGGKENLKLLDEAIKLRADCAKLLGYQTHADYVAEDRMAKDAATVQSFLARMKKGLEPALLSDTKKMAALKAADTKSKSAVINAWDWRYYLNQIKKNDFAIDDEAVRAYFPADKVLRGMFDVYATVLGVEMKEVAGPDTWFEGVKLFEVRDAGTKALVAKFYLDLYPRDGKYGHAAEFTLSPGHAVPGGYRVPLASLVVNFQPPKDGKPGLLSMDEVDTLFHEFGHVMHESLTTARYTQQSGTRTALDFVEAPSQMLENWAYQPEVLARISADPKDPSKPIPAELAQKLAAARKFDAGVRYSRQVFLGTFDSAIHAVKPEAATKLSADAVAKKSWADVMKLPEDKGAHFAGTFGHMMGGYDGGYYGYLWSEVFAADMFTRFAAEGVLNPKVGREYRDLVLARGRTVEPGVLLKDFLGREPNETAFLKMIGIAAP
ncbi:MAG: Zn-dependent oligopeptidase [Deltaproteobacteria bacterium]|nr:Zn-dependent oligopeptidase [Deltaproteobacteria bacterium]